MYGGTFNSGPFKIGYLLTTDIFQSYFEPLKRGQPSIKEIL
jgi:hypothetical protein